MPPLFVVLLAFQAPPQYQKPPRPKTCTRQPFVAKHNGSEIVIVAQGPNNENDNSFEHVALPFRLAQDLEILATQQTMHPDSFKDKRITRLEPTILQSHGGERVEWAERHGRKSGWVWGRSARLRSKHHNMYHSTSCCDSVRHSDPHGACANRGHVSAESGPPK